MTVVAGWYIGGRLAPWLVLALVIGIIVTVVSILVPPLGIALTIIGFIAWIIPALRTLKTFLRRLPYLVTSCAAYAYLWWVPRQLAVGAAAGPGYPGLVTLGIAAAGAALVGLLALAGRPLKERPQVGDHVIPSQPHHDFHARWAWCAEQADPCCQGSPDTAVHVKLGFGVRRPRRDRGDR